MIYFLIMSSEFYLMHLDWMMTDLSHGNVNMRVMNLTVKMKLKVTPTE